MVRRFVLLSVRAVAGELAGGPEAEDLSPAPSASSTASGTAASWPLNANDDSPALQYLKALTISSLLCLAGTVISQVGR